MDYKAVSQQVVDNVGGLENIEGATHCVTRLRLVLKDTSKYNKAELENIDGVKGVLYNSGQLMIIFGTGTVNKVYDEFMALTGVKEISASEVKGAEADKKGKFFSVLKVFSDIFIPIIPAFVGAAIIIGLKSLIVANGLYGMEGSLADNSELLKNLASFFAIIATTFDYLPVLVMYSAVKRFGGNPILGILVGIVMVHPSLMNRNTFVMDPTGAEYWNFGPLSIPMVAFQGGVFPAILTAWFMAKVEKIAQKYIPEVVSFVFVPTVTLILANVALFTVFGPLGNLIGDVLGGVIDILYNRMGDFGAFVFAAFLQPLVVTGTHQFIQGIEANLVATTGFNYIQAIWSVSIIAQGGGAIGMYLIHKKHSKERNICMSSFIPTLHPNTPPPHPLPFPPCVPPAPVGTLPPPRPPVLPLRPLRSTKADGNGTGNNGSPSIMRLDTALSLGNGIEYLRHPMADIIPYDIFYKQTSQQDTDHRIEQIQVIRPVLIEIAGQKMLYKMNDRLQDNSCCCRTNTDQKTDDQYEMLLFYMLVPP